MTKVDRSILQSNDQRIGDFGDPDKLEASITHLADKIDENDNGFNGHKTSTILDHPDKSVTEKKLADGAASGRVIANSSVKPNHLDLSLLNQDITTQAEFDLRGVNVKKLGAKGDKVADDTAAIQSAIDYVYSMGGGKVFLPIGKYIISKTLNLYTGVTVEGQGYQTELVIPDGLDSLFLGQGSLGTQYEFADDKTTGDTIIKTKTAHNITDGGLVYILSQRDALSDDAGEQWKLGYATPATPGCYFGEISRVKRVVDANNIELTGGLLFPSYLNDNTRDTSTTKRNSSTIQRFDSIRNVVLKNFRITGGSASKAIYFKYAYRCLVENVEFTSNADGSFIIFQESLSCKAKGCRVYYNPQTEMDNSLAGWHYSRNAYKIISAHSCGFEDCYGENATQTFDLTYDDGGKMPSIYCYVKDCETKGARHNAMTTHGGTYACSIEGNRFINNYKHGLSIRTRASIIKGNHIFGGKHYTEEAVPLETYGLNLYEGWARNCQIAENIVVGFCIGIEVSDAADIGERFGWIGGSIESNTIADCNQAIKIHRVSSNKYLNHVGLSIHDNTIVNPRGTNPYGIYVMNYVVGLIIEHNTINMNNLANSTCIYLALNTNDAEIIENHLYNSINGIVGVSVGYDAVSFTSANGVALYLENNTIRNIATANRYLLDAFYVTPKEAITSFHPKDDNVVSMGFSTKRFKSIQAVSLLGDSVKLMPTTAANVINNSFFVDSADSNKLKYKDNASTIRIVNLT